MAILKDKKSSADIDVLKQRFNQLQGGTQSAQQFSSPQQQVPPQQFAPPRQQTPAPLQQYPLPQQRAPVQAPNSAQGFATAPAQNPSQVVSQIPMQPTGYVPISGPAGKSAIEALNGPLSGPPSNADGSVNLVMVEGTQNTQVRELQVDKAIPPTSSQASSTSSIPESIIDSSLEDLKDEYDDAKLNSIIIDQVKELIEIDNNLNGKIENLRIDFTKEVEERKKFQQKLEDRYKEQKELEKSIEKFIALYEVVTNQFNPFVKKDASASQQRFNDLVSGIHVPTEKVALTEFVSKSGHKVKTLRELIAAVESMSDEDYLHHVDMVKNDFAVWAFHSLKDEELARKMMTAKKKAELITVLKEHK